MNIITTFDSTIYKKDSKDKIRVLRVYHEGADLIQESGLINGKLVIHRSTCKGKNIGKSNETTPEKQAMLEAIAKIETKMSTGYFATRQEAEDNVVILPMLAKSYVDESNKVNWTTAYVQPKLDGMRALGSGVKMISRKGKEIDTIPHIFKQVQNVGCANYLDGEVYAHGYNFQENMRMVKKYKAGETEKLTYHVYDLVANLPFKERYDLLVKAVAGSEEIEVVPTVKINNEKELQDHHKLFLAAGYEGTMLRWGTDGYKVNGRSSNLLKFKDFIDEVYKVVDIVPSYKNPKQGVVHCAALTAPHDTLKAISFGCGMKFSHEEREEMLINKADYIGQMAEIRFFEFSEDGVPRFPVCHGFRLDK
jgi:ATP-dependent DNA ligase